MSTKTRSNKQTEKVAEMEKGDLEDLIFKIVQGALKPLTDSVQTLTEEVVTLKYELKAKDERISKLENFVETKLDELEQYGRRNNLRIFGVPEEKRENTDNIVIDLSRKMGVNLDLCDIDRSHRVGRKGSSDRPIIVKFVSYASRSDVFGKKKCLKGTKTTVREDLTVNRLQVLKEAVSKYGVRRVWSMDGVIKINVGLLRPVGVKTQQQLNDTLKEFPPESLPAVQK